MLLSPGDARELGVERDDRVAVHANGDSVEAAVVVRTGVPRGSVFLSPPSLPDGPVEIKAREAVRA